jgi:hypothetical protein
MTNHRQRIFAFGVLGILVLCPISIRGDEFKWKLNAGDEFRVAISQESTVTTKYEARNRPLTNKTELELNWTVTSIENEIAVIEQKISRIAIELQTPTKDGSNRIAFDTSKPADAASVPALLSTQLTALIGLTFTTKMEANGSIVEVNVPDQTLTALRNAPSSTTFRQMLTVDGLKQLYGQSTFQLPKEDIRPNHSWKSSGSTDSPWGPIEIETVNVFDGPQSVEGRELQQFSFRRSLKQSEVANAGGATAAATGNKEPAQNKSSGELVNNSATGKFMFDATGGYFVSGQCEQKIETKLVVRDQLLETKLENNLSITITKK